MQILKDFKAKAYVCDDNVIDTLQWLMNHQDCWDSFQYDAVTQKLLVHHANGTDEVRAGQYLHVNYGILITS
jgi:hypothetical protein